MSNSGGKISKPVDVRGDIAYVLGRSTGDVGQLCSDKNSGGTDVGAINEWSLNKPYRKISIATTLADRQSAKYGWNIQTKSFLTSGSTASFLSTLYNMGDQAKCWLYEKPRGVLYNENFRVLDFDGYDHNMIAFREPIEFNRLTAYELNISGSYRDETIPRNRTTPWTLTYTSETFSLTGAFDAVFKFRITSPIGNYIRYYIEGGIDILLKDSQNNTVESWSDIFGIDQLGGTLPEVVINANYSGSFEDFIGPYHLEYRVLIDENTTHYVESDYNVYLDVDFQVETSYAASLSKYYRGTKGVYIKPSGAPAAYYETSPTAVTTLFGENSRNLCVVQVSNGSTTQRKIVWADMEYIPFKKIGITIEPRESTSVDDVIVYMLLGDYHMFPNFNINNCWGDISLADGYELYAYPHAMKKLGNMPAPPEPMVVYQDDFNSAYIEFSDGTREDYTQFTSYGLTRTEKNVNHLHFEWNFGVDNPPTTLVAVVTLHLVYDWGKTSEEVIADLTYTQTLNQTYNSFTAAFDYYYNPSLGYWWPEEMYARLWIEVANVRYYVNMRTFQLQSTPPEYQALGDDND